jgi:REP-associated tyrosine transposase
MPRHARLRIADVPLHVIQRGNNRSQCFHQERDYLVYLHLLEQMSRRHACEVHAYVLMTNHVHLLLTPRSADAVSGMMKDVGQHYSQFINRHYKRTGSLWEGRFRSNLVQDETYLMRCYRYVEMNPVRAGMVALPSLYRWSSHVANAQGAHSAIVIPHDQYLRLGSTSQTRRREYAELFGNELTESELIEIRAAMCGGFALGSPEFVRRIEAALGRPAHRRSPGRPRRLEQGAMTGFG